MSEQLKGTKGLRGPLETARIEAMRTSIRRGNGGALRMDRDTYDRFARNGMCKRDVDHALGALAGAGEIVIETDERGCIWACETVTREGAGQ
ncbi:MAG: hypothetical protein WB579_08805 [Bryobacteraceae bacterium]